MPFFRRLKQLEATIHYTQRFLQLFATVIAGNQSETLILIARHVNNKLRNQIPNWALDLKPFIFT